MARLGDVQLAALLEEIAAAMRVGTPVVDSMRRLQQRRLGRVGRLARQVSERLERGESVADAIAGLGTPTGVQVAAGIRACERGAEPSLLDRMAILLRRRAELAGQTRLAWAYPWLLLAIGYAVAVFVMAPLVRREQGRDFRWPESVLAVVNWLELYAWLPPILVGLVAVGWWLTRRGRDRLSRDDRVSLFCSALADQIGHEVPESDAIRTAAEFSGDPELTRLDEPTLKSAPVARLLDEARLPNDLGISEPSQTLIAQLRYVATRHAERARRRAYFWSQWVPRAATVVAGVTLTLSYAWWVIGPVYRQVAQW